MEELTLIELHLDGITFGNSGDDEGHLATPSISGSDDESETTTADMESADATRGLGRRIGRALAVTVVLAIIGRAVVGRLRGSDTDIESDTTDEPEVVSVDTAVAGEN